MLSEIQTDGFVWPHPDRLLPGHSPYSRQHARKHGYVAQIDFQGEAQRTSFYKVEAEFYNEYRPTCATESALLDELIVNYWRFQRARELENRNAERGLPQPQTARALLSLPLQLRNLFLSRAPNVEKG